MSALVRGERPALTGWERALQMLSWALLAISLGFAAVYIYVGLIQDAGSEYPYVTNSVAKDVLLAGLAWLVARDVRRHAAAGVPLIVAAHVVMPILLLATWWAGRDSTDHTMTWAFLTETLGPFRLGWLGVDVLMVVLFLGFSFMAVRSRYGLRYLWPSGYRGLIALAEVLVLRPGDKLAPAQIGERVDRYLASISAPEKLKVWGSFQLLAYWPLLSLHPPFHVMSPERRRDWVERRFLDQTRDWLMPRFMRDLRRAIIRTAQQFSFMGYYGDREVAAECGYVPFSERRPHEAAAAAREADERRGVECLSPADVSGTLLESDYVIVGSGAAGAMLAHELAAFGHEVLLLERGSHVDPGSFTEDEADQLARLYRDGALTLSKDFRFQVAQGMCVGGSTVVNNAVCLDLPDDVRDLWLGERYEAGLESRRLADAFAYVRSFLKVSPLGPAAIRNPGAEHLAKIVEALPPSERPLEPTIAEANVGTCLGCGYCNIGCRYGRKLSMLDWTLPETQRKYPGKLRVLPDCMVERAVKRDGRVRDVRARLADGRRLTVRGHSGVVLCAGALASSVILQRSRLGDGKAGTGLSFNMASPVTFDFEGEPLHSERGVQISHWDRQNGFIFETWFNPIVSQSLFMPGWFEQHRRNMLRYKHMTSLGAVVATGNDGTVKRGLTRGGVKLDYEPSDEDFVKIKLAVQRACEIGFRLGAKRVLPATLRGLELSGPEQLPLLETAIGDSSELLVNTSHPQGGNPISANPEKGVVDERFRVYGAPGLYVCDASVFPSAILVNPQLTVMALAAYAAEEITGQARADRDYGSTSQAVEPGPGT